MLQQVVKRAGSDPRTLWAAGQDCEKWAKDSRRFNDNDDADRLEWLARRLFELARRAGFKPPKKSDPPKPRDTGW